MAAEVLTQRSGRSEARIFGDQFDAQLAALEQPLRQHQALGQQPAVWGGTGCLDESARKRPGRHVRPRREAIDCQPVIQPALRPGENLRNAVIGTRVRDDGLGVLRLAARPVRRHHHPPSYRIGDHSAVLLADDVQAEIDPGGRPGAASR